MYRLIIAGYSFRSGFNCLSVRNNICSHCFSIHTSLPPTHKNSSSIVDFQIFKENRFTKVNFTPIRYQSNSTTAGIVKLTKRKRKKIRSKKWTELLQVTNQSTKETRTKVEKLRAKTLSEFIDNKPALDYPSMPVEQISSRLKDFNSFEYEKFDLEMLVNLENGVNRLGEKPIIFLGKDIKSKLSPQSNNFKNIIASLEQFQADVNEIAEEVLDDVITAEADDDIIVKKLTSHNNSFAAITDGIVIEDVIEEEKSDVIIPEINETNNKHNKNIQKEHRFKHKMHKSAEHQEFAKQKSLANNLISYMNACVANNMLNRGFSTILNYRFKYKKFGKLSKALDIELYNIIMHGFAEKGNYDKILEICSILKEDEIKYNAQTYAAILECLSRLENTEDNQNLIRKYLKNAELMGITKNDIIDRSKFVTDQREMVLDAICRVEPNFNPVYTPPILTYENILLNRLNEGVRDIGKRIEPKWYEEQNKRELKSRFTTEQLQTFAKNQLTVELEGYVTVKSIEKPKLMHNVKVFREKLQKQQEIWKGQIYTAIVRDLNLLRATTHFKLKNSMTYYTYLKCLDTGQYVDILLNEIRKLAEGSETYSPTVGQLFRELGQKVYHRYQIEQKKRNGTLEKFGEIYMKYCEQITSSNASVDNTRQIWQRLVHEDRASGPSMDIEEIVWTPNVMSGVGRFLYNILMRDIKVDANIMRQNSKTQNLLPAFYTLYRNEGKQVKEEVKPHPVLSRLFRAAQQQTLTFDSNLLPMLCPPQPWSTPVNGGYMMAKSELIRLPQQAVQQWTRIKEMPPQSLYPSLDSLNQLASIPWKVNTKLLDVILEVFNNGGDANLDVPQPPTALEPLQHPNPGQPDSELSNKDKYQLFRLKLARRRKQAEMYSLWCDALYRLSLANHYRDKTFWLPHNMDFRGRVYPLPPHLNHLGSDLARSLLVFHDAKPLGVDGFSWLKLHCINLTGKKKRESIKERLLYAEEIMDDILDSASNPLNGRMWWAESDEPWQTLACCMEIAKVHKCPEPEKYMSHFPIHQDGSCNGLQHYAALGRDQAGAVSVNLTPAEVPQDVYSAVAVLVEKCRSTDAANGIEIAKVLEGFVRRKVIKQTVMTTVYGVTRYGARLQIARQLKDISDFPKDWVWPASTYLTTKTFESLREMFKSTKEIQDWFTDCARLISSISGENVEWITPLGLPVVQPYTRFTEIKSSSTSSGKVSNTSTPMDIYEKPNVVKQKNAFPPNFIHSLDSSHMMLTSLFCERHGMTFISVHDCFWTHACTVPDMNKICREQFVALHSQPILENLSKYLIAKFSYSEREIKNDGTSADLAKHRLNNVLRQLPEKGDFNLENILKSVYFFS